VRRSKNGRETDARERAGRTERAVADEVPTLHSGDPPDAVAASAPTGIGSDRLRGGLGAALPAERATVALPNDGDTRALLARTRRGRRRGRDHGADAVVVDPAARTSVLE
jgi:hypothetical protein